MTRYYLAGGQRIAFRVIKSGQADKVFYLLADHLGSTNVVMQVGGVVENKTYTAWGKDRTGSISKTDRQYTGQINESELGLYFYNARYYDPDLGRFISADSIVPQPGNPLGWDRYAYTRNNPLRYTDPTGHYPECGPDGVFCDSSGNLLNRSALYDAYVNFGFFVPLPDPSKIFDSRYNTMKRVINVLANYDASRRALFIKYGMEFIDHFGKILDEVFMALIIAGEFGVEKSISDSYYNALEALSNQYKGTLVRNPGPMQCLGACKLSDQLLWATQMEAWYSAGFVTNTIRNDAWLTYFDDAKRAKRGYAYGPDTSWFWGNVSEQEKKGYGVVYERRTNVYSGKPWWIVYAYKIYGE